MWWHSLFKPTPKVGQVEVLKEPAPLSLGDKLHTLCVHTPVDTLFKSAVMRRFLLTLYWPDVQMLFDALLYNKKDTPTMTAVNIHTYFKAAGTLPSVCLERLAKTLNNTSNVPYSVHQDVHQLIIQLEEANTIHLSQSQENSQ